MQKTKHHFRLKNEPKKTQHTEQFLNEGLAHMHFAVDSNSTSPNESKKHSRRHDAGAHTGRAAWKKS